MTVSDRRIVLTIEEYKGFVVDLNKQIAAAYKAYTQAFEASEDGEIDKSACEAAKIHWESLLKMEEQAAKRMTEALVIRPEEVFARDITDSMLNENEE